MGWNPGQSAMMVRIVDRWAALVEIRFQTTRKRAQWGVQCSPFSKSKRRFRFQWLEWQDCKEANDEPQEHNFHVSGHAADAGADAFFAADSGGTIGSVRTSAGAGCLRRIGRGATGSTRGPDCALPGLTGRPNLDCCDLSGPSCRGGCLVEPEHGTAPGSARGWGERHALGPGRQRSYRVSLCPRQSRQEHRLDVAARQRLLQPARRRHERCSGHAVAGAAVEHISVNAATTCGCERRRDQCCAGQSGCSLRSLLQSLARLGAAVCRLPGLCCAAASARHRAGSRTCLRRGNRDRGLCWLRLGVRCMGAGLGERGRVF